MITALLIDDDANLRNGMKSLLARYAPEIKILGEADSVETGVEAIQNLKPEVVFLDIQLNEGTGFDILEQVAKTKENLRRILFLLRLMSNMPSRLFALVL